MLIIFRLVSKSLSNPTTELYMGMLRSIKTDRKENASRNIAVE
jgi:hypothetical protein